MSNGGEEKETVARQIYVPMEEYNNVQDLQLAIKRETGKKPFLQDLLVDLIADGIKWRKKHGNNHKTNEATEFSKWYDLTRDDVFRIRNQVMTAVTSGEVSIKELIVAIASFERVFIGDKNNPGIKSMIMPYVAREIEREGGPGQVGNYEIALEKVDVYDYSSDPVWQILRTEEQVAAEKRKGREEFLKSMSQANQVQSSSETVEGVTYSVKLPTKKIAPQVLVKLKK